MAAICHNIKDYAPCTSRPPSKSIRRKMKRGIYLETSKNEKHKQHLGTKRQCSFELKHGQSFRSETSDVRHILSATALDRENGQTSPTVAAASGRKRRREAPDLDRGHSRARRRGQPCTRWQTLILFLVRSKRGFASERQGMRTRRCDGCNPPFFSTHTIQHSRKNASRRAP